MKKALSFDDVLITPNFSFVKSRKDVSLEQPLMGYRLGLPIIASNMDTICGASMANAMNEVDAVGALHRFCTIEENIAMFKASWNTGRQPLISVGLGAAEFERAKALSDCGATQFVLDVAHGASMEVVRQFKELNELPYASIMVGNFATGQSIFDFEHHAGSEVPAAYKVGIGGGSMCTTRIVTGCGMPTLASVIDCAKTYRPIVADGGIRNSGDIAKALAAGARAVMVGSLLSGTKETPAYEKAVEQRAKEEREYREMSGLAPLTEEGYRVSATINVQNSGLSYRGSASNDSYKVQGKVASHRAPEGAATTVPYKGSVKPILEELAAGVRSAMSYVGATNLEEFRQKALFMEITSAGMSESKPHGVKS